MGDSHQAIYGFSGSDTQSIPNIIKRTQATVLPLSICYRCPTSHLDLAREIVPHIQAAPGAKTGSIIDISEDKLLITAGEGDLIIARMTAPLVKTCLALIRSGIAAKVRGRDIGSQLVNTFNQALQNYRPQVELETQVMKDAISQWEKEMIADLKRQDDSELAQESVRDRAECLRVLVNGKKRSIEKVREDIADLFSETRSSVWLSTVHRAKGLEAKRIFILEPNKMPHPKAKKGWQIEQEWNLKYVALTRAQDELFVVGQWCTNNLVEKIAT